MSYNLEEVFEMAYQIERNGAAFYRKAASAATSNEARSMFNDLADWENKHEDILKQLYQEIPEERRKEYYDPYGEAAGYLDMAVHGKVFPASVPKDDMPSAINDIFRVAIEKEKDSILFYLGLKGDVPNAADQVDRIIAEEMRHVTILSGLAEKANRR